MMSEASFRALEAASIFVIIKRSLPGIISPFCSPSASMTLALACLEAEMKMKMKKSTLRLIDINSLHLQLQLPWLSGVVEGASHPSPQLSRPYHIISYHVSH